MPLLYIAQDRHHSVGLCVTAPGAAPLTQIRTQYRQRATIGRFLERYTREKVDSLSV